MDRGRTPALGEAAGRARDAFGRLLGVRKGPALACSGTIPMMTAIDDQLPGVPLFAASGMLALPELALPPGPAHVEAVGPALPPERMGYEAMRLVLAAVDEGRRNRRHVVSAALRPRRRAATDRIALYRPAANGHFTRVRP